MRIHTNTKNHKGLEKLQKAGFLLFSFLPAEAAFLIPIFCKGGME